MSEHDDGEGEGGFVSIGERLRRAREARGMSLDDVASQTRIPMRHLQHIELEDWDALPAPTYAIGFARNYANAVGLDGPAIAGELRDWIGGPRRRAPAPEYYEPADPARVPPRSIVIAAALAGAAAGRRLFDLAQLLAAASDEPTLDRARAGDRRPRRAPGRRRAGAGSPGRPERHPHRDRRGLAEDHRRPGRRRALSRQSSTPARPIRSRPPPSAR